jgi:hypothetical protein
MTGNPKIDQCIDALCAHGCRAVREYIETLRAGGESPHWAELDAAERGLLRRELEGIMTVYGDKCPL